MYLVHIPVLSLLARALAYLPLSQGIRWVLTLVLLFLSSTAVAYLLHLLVEKQAGMNRGVPGRGRSDLDPAEPAALAVTGSSASKG